jgi:hypothetical protein
MIRPVALGSLLGIVSVIVACGSGGGEDDGGSGGASSGGSAGTSSGGSGGQSASGGSGGQSASGGSDSGGRDGGGTGGQSGSSGSGGSTTSCVKETRVLHDLVMDDAGGQTDLSICDFTVPADVDQNYINVFVGRSVGAGTKVCWRASSQGCTPNGFWFNGGQILLCDQTCSDYFDPEPDLVVYIEIGCEIDSCL